MALDTVSVRRHQQGQDHPHNPPSNTRASILTTVLAFVVIAATGMQAWHTVRLAGFDLGIFDQGIRAYAHLHLPRSPIKNVHHNYAPDFSLLGDHFSPILALLAPLYWLWDDPRVLILSQAALFAVGVPLVRSVAMQVMGDATPAARRIRNGAGLVYALGWPLLTAASTGFHEVAFAVPLMLLMLERAMAGRYAASVASAALLCCTKEDLGLTVGTFGLLLICRAKRQKNRRGLAAGTALCIAGPLASALAITWAIPAMGGTSGYYWSYDRLGKSPGDALVRVAEHPWTVLTVASTPHIKLALLLWIFGTVQFLALLSPTVLVAVPLLAERILSDDPNHWPAINHYDAFAWPILVVACIEGIARLRRQGRGWRNRAPWIALGAACTSLAASAFLGLAALLSAPAWTPTQEKTDLVRAAALIPSGVSVEADNSVAPRLTSRTHVVIADGIPRGADYVLLRTEQRTFPFSSVAQQQARVALLLGSGYQRIWSQDGVVLLRRTRQLPIPGMHLPGPGSIPIRDTVPSDVGHDLFRR